MNVVVIGGVAAGTKAAAKLIVNRESHQLQLMQQSRHLALQGKTMLMVIHDLPHAFQVADKPVVMENQFCVLPWPQPFPQTVR